jgi:NAD(P)-dependent dehydrogenase (short-subunit alcohol dehydrogenase family)
VRQPAALVTGATRGIGLACAETFTANGWGVVIVGRGGDALKAAARKLGDHAVAVRGDVAVASTSQHAVAAGLDRFGRLDAVVGNAGATVAKSVDDTTEQELERLIAVNLKGLVYLAQASHTALARSRGSFVVVASNKGIVAQRQSAVYVATKGAAVQHPCECALPRPSRHLDARVIRGRTTSCGPRATPSRERATARPARPPRGVRRGRVLPRVKRLLVRIGRRAAGRRGVHRAVIASTRDSTRSCSGNRD